MPIFNTEYKSFNPWNWDLSKAGTPTTFTLSSPMGICYSLQLSPTGDMLYVSGWKWNNTVWVMQQYELSTPRDITTASLKYSIDYGWSWQWWGYPQIMLWNNWQYLYFMDYPTSPNALIVYSLATAWDINSTKTEITRYSWNLSPQWFSEDGKAYIYGCDGAWSNPVGFFYSTNSTAWNITYPWTSISSVTPWWAKISADGNYLYILASSKQITKYKMATKRDPTSTLTQEQQVTLSGWNYWVFFDTEWNNLYTAGWNNTIYQYSLL